AGLRISSKRIRSPALRHHDSSSAEASPGETVEILEWVARGGRRADGKERGRRIPAVGWNDRATPPAALLPRAVDGCVDFGAGLRCSLDRDHCGYRRCASRLGQRQNPQQRDPLQYFNSLLRLCLPPDGLVLWRARDRTSTR